MNKLEKLSESEMNAIIGGESNHSKSGGKWVYDSNTGKWYWVEVCDSTDSKWCSDKESVNINMKSDENSKNIFGQWYADTGK